MMVIWRVGAFGMMDDIRQNILIFFGSRIDFHTSLFTNNLRDLLCNLVIASQLHICFLDLRILMRKPLVFLIQFVPILMLLFHFLSPLLQIKSFIPQYLLTALNYCCLLLVSSFVGVDGQKQFLA